MTIIQRLNNYLGLVRFSHTIFALPFAFMSALSLLRGIPSWRIMLWIMVCMVGARTSAMTFNRIVDRRIDAKIHEPGIAICQAEQLICWKRLDYGSYHQECSSSALIN